MICENCGSYFPTDEDINEFEELCKPLVEYIQILRDSAE